MILAILHDGARHGYDIAREVSRRSDSLITFNQGILYPTLHALEHDEMITSEWEHVPGERSRRMYRLTPKGEGEYERLTARWDSYARAMYNVLGKRPEDSEQTA